jgi:hypothetical protein
MAPETEEPNTKDVDDSIPVIMTLGRSKLSVKGEYVSAVIKFIQHHMEKCPNLKAERCVEFAFEKAIALDAIQIGDTSIWKYVDDDKTKLTINNDDENTDGNIVVIEDDSPINDPTEF